MAKTASSRAVIPFLVTMMLVTGVCNTILTKYQDMQCVRNCSDPNPRKRVYFEQPVIQTLQMFIGEVSSWLVIAGHNLYTRYAAYKRQQKINDRLAQQGRTPRADDPLLARRSVDSNMDDDEDEEYEESHSLMASTLLLPNEDRQKLDGWRVMLLALPACCDIAGTTLMNVGLLFVVASIYQMTRGALVLFVGLFSVLFLKRHLSLYKWFALFVVVAGVAVVGLAGAIAKEHKATGSSLDLMSLLKSAAERNEDGELSAGVKTVIGVSLIAAAQIFTATQFVIEENIMEKYSLEPLKAVGWEGLWGLIATIIGMIVMHFAYGRTAAGQGGYFDAREGLYQILHFKAIGISSIFIMISIGGFNFFGLSVTRTVSATSRSTIDTCRTLFIWVISLGLGWESFKWLQVVGFGLLVYGTFLFNDIVRPPLQACADAPVEDEENDDGVVQQRSA